MKYTKEHLWDKADIEDLPYINVVMKGIEIKEYVGIEVGENGCIHLKDITGMRKNRQLILFGSYYHASQKSHHLKIELYAEFIKIKKTKEMVEKTIYSFVGEGE